MKRLSFLTFALALLFLFTFSAAAADISPAIGILRDETAFTKCALKGKDVTFSLKDFENAVGTTFDYVTFYELPSPEDGVLKVGTAEIIKGQSLTASNLNMLKFSPMKEEFEVPPEFSFAVSSEDWKNTEIFCKINYLDSINYAPISNSFLIETVENVSVYAPVSAYDPDGDDITVYISGYPSNGTVTVDNKLKTAIYTPAKSFTGTDVISYYVKDSFGNVSDKETIYVTVENQENKVCFGDMGNSNKHFAAISLSEDNIMTYTAKGGEYYFEPEATVNNIDFTVMLLCAAKLTDGIEAVKDTPFLDDVNLSIGRRAYLKRALDLKIAETGDGYFHPLDPISSEKAKAMVSKALSLGETSRELASIMGSAENKKALTKEDVAEILYNVCLYTENK